jgi:hypothetical protein
MRVLLCCAVVAWGVACAYAEDHLQIAHWVWNRTEPLGAAETEALHRTGGRELLWNPGTLEREGTQWRGPETWVMPPAPDKIRVIPVVRLHHAATTLEDPNADAGLVSLLGAWCRHHRADELQLDYDCPDRLLARYAAVLAKVRAELRPARLTATALAHWPGVAGFAELCGSVDELAPMFYDLETHVPKGVPTALLEEKKLRAQMNGWRTCPVPWRAGLPNFTRVSLLAPSGALAGQLEEWRWDELTLHPALALETPTTAGVTVLRAERAVTLRRHPVEPGGQLVVRWPDLEVLRAGVRLAADHGARGVIFFKLPRPASPSGWSLDTLHEALQRAPAPAFQLVMEPARLTLRHVSAADLPPRFASKAGARDAGWTLELDLNPADVLDLAPGEFALRDKSTEKQSARVTLRFTSLRSGGMIRTGFFQCLTTPKSLRWRIPELSGAWQDAVPLSR